MGFVATAEETENWHWKPGTAGPMLSEILRVPFVTDGAFARSVLPPCLEVADGEVNGLVAIRRTFPRTYEPYELCGVRLEATYEGYTGMYDLVLVTSGDMPVTVGRELLGECKKMGNSYISHDGLQVTGTTVRDDGKPLVTITGVLDDAPDTPVGSEVHNQFDLLAMLDETGAGFHNDPTLVTLERIETDLAVRAGQGSLSFTPNKNIPLHTIPILRTGEMRYSLSMVEFTPMKRHQIIKDGVDAADYLPYVISRSYDLYSEPSPFTSGAEFLSAAEQDRLAAAIAR